MNKKSGWRVVCAWGGGCLSCEESFTLMILGGVGGGRGGAEEEREESRAD